MRHFIVIFIAFLLFTAPLYGQAIICAEDKIRKMIKFEWSDEDIQAVCGKFTRPEAEEIVKKQTTPKKTKIKKASLKPVKKKIKSKPLKPVEEEKIETPPKREEEKPKIILNYSAKLGVRSNEGSLITKSLNPPKNTNTRFYLLYGQIVNSEENNKISYLHTLDTFLATTMIIGIDNRLAANSLHYISLSYSSTNYNIHQKTRYDSTSNNVYYDQRKINRNYIDETLTLEYVHHLLDDLLVGLSYKSVSLIRDIKYDYQWYKLEDDSKYEGNGGTVKYESNHDYNYNSLRLQKIINSVRFDFHFTPEVTSKENYSGDYTGESTSGFGRSVGLNLTIQGLNHDISFGHSKENENTDVADPEKESSLLGYNYSSPNIVYNVTIDYRKSEKISGLIEPYTMLDIVNKLSFLNTYIIGYEYINYKYDDIGESSDKYRKTEQHLNWLYFGISFDL